MAYALDMFGDWVWQSLVMLAGIAPLGTFIVAIVALVTYRTKKAADRRGVWWQRAEWAIDHALSADPQTRSAGLAAMRVMDGHRDGGGKEKGQDREFFTSVAAVIQSEEMEGLDTVPLASAAEEADNGKS